MKNQKISVLIIDDSPIIIERLVPEIEEMEFVEKVIVGFTFDEAKQLILSAKFSIAIFDINLRDRNGLDLLRYQKFIDPTVKIIMMTGDHSIEKHNACMDLGADYFLNKFTELENLQEIIKQLMANRI
ncbi:response regulator [Cytophaga aurantiaca]|uniref:response regulator n=1 Tax=Cytophaga aurantiaca TaxID=29530 RepID=UPI00036335C0|nr:response regulator [Cytophaga aurantiaca]